MTPPRFHPVLWAATIVAVLLLPLARAAAGEIIPATAAEVTITGASEDWIGGSVALGDINGDQLPDLVIGAPGG